MNTSHHFMIGSLLVLLGAASCGGSNVASHVKPKQLGAAEALGTGGTTCKSASYAEPLVVDLPADKRVDLEAAMKEGVVLVSYDCNKLQVLKDCRLAGEYRFAGVSRKSQVVSLTNEDELRANLPFSQGSVGGSLESGNTLELALVMIGKRSTAAKVQRPLLEGSQCGDATHFVRSAVIGAFAAKTGEVGKVAGEAQIFGFGSQGGSKSEDKRAQKDGDLGACEKSQPDAAEPPAECRSPLRLELVPVAAEEAKGKGGDKKEGKEGEDKKLVIENPCPEGYALVGGKCTRDAAGGVCDQKSSDTCKAQCDKGNLQSCHNYATQLYSSLCRDPSKKAYCDEHTADGNEKLMEEDEKQAIALWKKACDGNVGEACYEYGTSVDMKTMSKEAAAALQKGCDLGVPDSCETLGSWYFGGKFVTGDEIAGLSLWQRGCKLGDAYACQEVGKFYFKGTHVAKNPRRGYEFLKQFCDQGDWETCSELGQHLLDVYGNRTAEAPVADVPDAKNKGRALLELACKHDEGDACGKLGTVLFAAEEYEAARKFLPKGCESDGDVCKLLARAHEEGLGGPKNRAKAIEAWLSSQEDPLMLKAAKMLASGDGVPKDRDRGKEIAQKLCSDDYKPACKALADL